ncbi:BON domain-containing protein [Phormidesmis sp. 146-35]
MKKFAFLLFSGVLAISVSACGPAKTSSEAPNTTAEASPNMEKPTAQANQDDATNETRRKQLNSDIRAAEERNKVAGDQSVKTNNDLQSQVRSKLEANLPASALAVEANEGNVTVTGTVVNQAQLQKIESLAKEISGVKSVDIKATINTAAKPAAPKPGSADLTKESTGAK